MKKRAQLLAWYIFYKVLLPQSLELIQIWSLLVKKKKTHDGDGHDAKLWIGMDIGYNKYW